jgi:hypothetical protein
MITIENRIKRLEFEEKRALNMAEAAEVRAARMLDNRKRHF